MKGILILLILFFLTESDEKLEYTFAKDNKEYKYVEFFNNDATEVTSYIYEKNQKTNEYEKKDHLITILNTEENNISMVSKITGETSVIHLGEDIIEIVEKDPIQLSSTWKYKSTTYGNNKPTKWTVGAIAITIAAITKVPASAKWVITLAAFTYNLSTDVIYWKKVTYLKTGRSKLNPCMKIVTTLYEDKSRKKVIKSGIVGYSGRNRCP